MPLYMEYHKASNITISDLKERVRSGSDMLTRFSVSYHQLWVDEESGTVFCLIEAPNRAICEAVHRNIYGAGLGSIRSVTQCLKETSTSYRDALSPGVMLSVGPMDTRSDRFAPPVPANIKEIVECHGGVLLSPTDTWCIAAYFPATPAVVRCCIELQHLRATDGHSAAFRIVAQAVSGIEAGTLLKTTRRLQCITGDPVVLVQSGLAPIFRGASGLTARILSQAEESFLDDLFDIFDEHLHDENFNVDALARFAGISRPQLYRKVHSLTSRSPHSFIRDLRMEKALVLLKKRDRNISEIALEVGYANPSYFARSFCEKYGCTPSCYLFHDN